MGNINVVDHLIVDYKPLSDLTFLSSLAAIANVKKQLHSRA